MKQSRKMLAVLILGVALLAGATYGQVAGKQYAEGVVAADGSIRVPEDFRVNYLMLGAWSVTGDADTGGNIGLHVVYAPKEAVEVYRKTGQFPTAPCL